MQILTPAMHEEAWPTDRGLKKDAFAPTYLDGAYCGRLNTATLFTPVPVEGAVHSPTCDSGPALDLLRLTGRGEKGAMVLARDASQLCFHSLGTRP